MVATGWNPHGRIAWFENTGDPTSEWKVHSIKERWSNAVTVLLTDLDQDGRLDIVACAERGANEIRWWRNVGSTQLVQCVHGPKTGPRKEPQALEISHEPQFFVDDYLVDNRWGVEYLKETVTRVFHPPYKDKRNPLIAGRGGYVNVVRDEQAGVFRMWYQDYWDQSLEPWKYFLRYCICGVDRRHRFGSCQGSGSMTLKGRGTITLCCSGLRMAGQRDNFCSICHRNTDAVTST